MMSEGLACQNLGQALPVLPLKPGKQMINSISNAYMVQANKGDKSLNLFKYKRMQPRPKRAL